MLIKRSAIGFCIVLLSILLTSPLFAQNRPGGSNVLISVTSGKRLVVDSNIQQAKQQAEKDALAVAVQNAFSHLVSRDVFASNLDFFYDHVQSHSRDYIVTYRVLGGIQNKRHFLVAVESKVDLDLLEKTLTDARILNANKDKPVILFFIAEKTPTDILPKYWWGKNPIPYQSLAENIIIRQLVQDRFIVTGNGENRPDPAFYNILFDSIYDINAAKDLGREMKADIVVFGKAQSSEAINRMGEERTFNGTINLEGYHLETGEKVIVSQVQAAATSQMDFEGNADAIEKAAGLSAIDLSQKLDAYWNETLRKEHAFDLRIEGGNFLPRFLALKQKLKQMPGMENLQPKEMGSTSAIMEVFYKGKPVQFADTIMLKTFESFGLEISEVTDELVVIKFIEKDNPSFLGEKGQSELPEATDQPAGDDSDAPEKVQVIE